MADAPAATPVNPLLPKAVQQPAKDPVEPPPAGTAPAGGQPPAADAAAKAAADERRAERAARARREEARLLTEREKLKRERADWEVQNASARRAMDVLKEGQRLAKENPREFLKWAGFTPEQLTTQLGKPGEPDKRPVDQIVAAELAKFEAKYRAERQEAEAKAQKQALDDQNKNFIAASKATIKGIMAKDAEKFELCGMQGDAPDRAWKIIEDTYAKFSDPTTGRLKESAPKEILDLFQPHNQDTLFTFALEAVESGLVEDSITRYEKSKKIRTRLDEAAKKKAETDRLEKEKADEAARAAAATKTGFYRKQSPAPSPSEPPKGPPRILSRQQRIELARKSREALAANKAS